MEAPASLMVAPIRRSRDQRGSVMRQAPSNRNASSTPTARIRKGIVEDTGLKGRPMKKVILIKKREN